MLKMFWMGARYPGWGILPPGGEDTQGQDTTGYLHPQGASCPGGQDKLLHRSIDRYGWRWPAWFSLLSHLWNHWMNFAETFHVNSSQFLDMSARKRFQSINKCGRTAAIFKVAICPLLNTVTISLSHLIWDHWSDFFRNLPEMFP